MLSTIEFERIESARLAFTALREGEVIHCAIDFETMDVLERSTHTHRTIRLSQFERMRPTIEHLTNRKSNAGQTEAGEPSIVIRVSDLQL